MQKEKNYIKGQKNHKKLEKILSKVLVKHQKTWNNILGGNLENKFKNKFGRKNWN